jgi:deoxycytidine triphosphate deaminase
MILSQKAIRQALKLGKLNIRPFSIEQIEKAHINLHIDQEVSIAPGEFVLAKTREKISLSDELCAFMEGRATLAKQGISIEQSSTFIEPGSDDQMTLEIFNAGKKAVTLTPGQPVAKMFLLKVTDSV